MSQKKKIIITGGGLAGLSAAFNLSWFDNFKIKVVERAPFAGGCTSSWEDWRDPERGEIQYPMHMIFPPLYVNFLSILRYLNLQSLTPKFERFFFFDEKNKMSVLASSELAKRLPAPLHGLKILWDFDGCSIMDKLSTVRFFLFCIRYGGLDLPPASDQYNFYGFCRKLGMTEEAIKAMARITYSITNLPPSEQIGPKFARLFYEVILSHSEALGYQMINDNYNPGLIDPWVEFLKKRGVEFYFNHEVNQIVCEGRRVAQIKAVDHNSDFPPVICYNCGLKFPLWTKRSSCPKCGIGVWIDSDSVSEKPKLVIFEGDYFISCLQPHQLSKIILSDPGHPLRDYSYFRNLGKYKGASLSFSRIWLDRKCTSGDNLTGLDRHYFSFNGIMDISNIMPKYTSTSVFDTLSDDGDTLKLWPSWQFKQALLEDMQKVFPETKGVEVKKHLLAHIYPNVLYHIGTPEISSLCRPKTQQSPIDNFVLGGDWISTLEIGMEGAVRSGLGAANLILRKEDLKEWPIKQPKRGWAMEKLERFNTKIR